ncbi:MAG: hypothetical protein SFX73_03635 [Kofleriaceae bacterium]|nr:hypothetical protein [Kofleriaceae bacterium]
MRAAWVVLVGAVGCGHGGIQPMVTACERARGADPGACLAVARDRLARHDQTGVQQYMENTVQAIIAAPRCLDVHAEESCFAGVAVLLRDEPVGLLADYNVTQELLQSLPRWNGPDAEGPRAQARTVLQGMCTTERGSPAARQRACLVLGDLVEDERVRRCGPNCDLAQANELLAGWTKTDVIDGYATACKLARATPDTAFAEQVAKVYGVSGGDAACAVSKAELRGASIPNAVAGRARAIFEANQRANAAAASAAREAQRTAELKKREEEARVARAKAADAEATQQLVAAASNQDWPALLAHMRKRRLGQADAAAATAVAQQWDPFVTWLSGESSIIGAYIEIDEAVRLLAPRGHALLDELEGLRTRALAEVRKRGKTARGPGGVWLYAALAERVAGPGQMVEANASAAAFAKLNSTARVSLVIDKLVPACASIRPEMRKGRTVRATSTLTCTIEPEKKWTTTEMVKVKQHVVKTRTVMKDGREQQEIESEEDVEQDVPNEVAHRTYKVVVRGELAITSGAPRRVVPIELEDVLEDGDADDTRTFEAARAKAIQTIHAAVIGPVEAGEATKAYAAAQQALAVKRAAAAENQLVIHGLLAGASPELDELLSQYALVFTDLLPTAAKTRDASDF